MLKCNTCGNTYDKCMEIIHRGRHYVFDCFECAMHALAPVCAACGCRIIGHGSEADGKMFCCAHCASQKGVSAVTDRV